MIFRYLTWAHEAHQKYFKEKVSQHLKVFQRFGWCNAMDGSEDNLIQLKEGKNNYDMSSLMPLSKWKAEEMPSREDYSDSEDESDPFEEEYVLPQTEKKKKKPKVFELQMCIHL